MEHGVQNFFLERARCRRRVAVVSASLGAFLLLLLGVASIPPVSQVWEETRFARFGFEGPTRYVRLVRVEAVRGADDALTDIGKVEAPPARRGGERGGGLTPARRSGTARGKTPSFDGRGEANYDLVARALSGQSHVPVFQSDELIIEHLVRPAYPEDVRDRGVEGRVSVIAPVDTLGEVIEAQVWTRSGEPQLDRAAEVAVRQCRFRPYRVRGAAREVYAVFRFAFRLY
jgi:TonB family protein